MNKVSLIGNRYGRLVVKSEAESRGSGVRKKAYWLCVCDCGKEKIISANSLRAGYTKSCGCIKKESGKNPNYRHGGKGTRLYSIWKDMRKRCNNPNSTVFEYYGGKGIRVCKEWDQFENFRNWALENGYSDELTIDREEADKDYSPSNCRWVTFQVQYENKRNNRYITVEGQTMTVTEASKKYDIRLETLIRRLNSGWSDEEAALIRPRKT